MDTNNNVEERNLFADFPEESANQIITLPDVPSIVGLQYIRDFIDQKKHDDLLCQIDSAPWLTELKRRVQHYGYKYDYKSRSVNHSMHIGPLPQWAEELAHLLFERRLTPERPDQVIVNEYRRGQGIANHVDCVPCFADTIISLSLGSACVMKFTNKETHHVFPLLLEPRSLVILQGEARFDWMHGIPARKTDQYQNMTIQRGRRVSLTFRKVILESVEEGLVNGMPLKPKVDVEHVRGITISSAQMEACKRALSETAERVLGCPLDLEQPEGDEVFRVRLVTPTQYRIDIGYLGISENGKVASHHITTPALQTVLEELSPEYRR
jgi:alkylated DNA repair dioxygenase AlkB